MKPLTFEEAGLVLIWVGNEMRNADLFAGATLDFEYSPGNRRELMLHLAENGIEEDRAVEIADDITLEDLIGTDLVDE